MFGIKLILPFLLLSTFVCAQNSTLFQNVNFRAKELKHQLNKTGDSILLHGERTIYSVNIYNIDNKRTFKIGHDKADIPVSDLGVGRYVVEVVLYDKRIIITLVRNKPLVYNSEKMVAKVTHSDEKPKQPEELTRTQIASVTEKESAFLRSETRSKSKTISNSLNSRTSSSKVDVSIALKRAGKYGPSNYHYWVIDETKNGSYSRKIMKMTSLAQVERLIEKNQLDTKTLKGQSNILTIWEVYDKTNFYKQKRMNSDYLNTTSEHFNKTPYYKTADFGDDTK